MNWRSGARDPRAAVADNVTRCGGTYPRHRTAGRQWSIEVAIEDGKQIFGTRQARNRTARAVERTIPFTLACGAITTCW
jgi:hypothetical protein